MPTNYEFAALFPTNLLEEEIDQEAKKYIMAKLREKDKRPRHKFKAGDIVRYKPGKNSMPSGEGIVLKTEYLESNDIRQRCYCLFAADGATLRTEARKIAKKIFYEPDYKAAKLQTIENNRLEYVRDCPRSWLQPITSMEIQTLRFSDLLEEEDDGPKS